MIDNIFSILLHSAFLITGIAIYRTPAKTLLSWDRMSGYGVYKKHLKKTGNEEEAINKAAKFYKLFALLIIFFSLLFLTISLL